MDVDFMIYVGSDVAECVEVPPDIDIEPNGVELGIDEIYRIEERSRVIVDGDKREIRPLDGKKDMTDIYRNGDMYEIPTGVYQVRLANKITIPEDAVGFAFPRSTLSRFGIMMFQTSVWDSGYSGYGSLTVKVNVGMLEIDVDEKWFQFILVGCDEVDKLYDGHWQNEGIGDGL